MTYAFALLLVLASPAPEAGHPGRAVYESACIGCHSPTNVMVASPKAGDRAEWARRLQKGLDEVTRSAVNGIGAMPAKGGCGKCTPEQIREAIKFMAGGVPADAR